MNEKVLDLIIQSEREPNKVQLEYELREMNKFGCNSLLELSLHHSKKETQFANQVFDLWGVKNPISDCDIYYIPIHKPNISSGYIEGRKSIFVYHGISVLGHFLGSINAFLMELYNVKIDPLIKTFLFFESYHRKLILIYKYFSGEYELSSIINGFNPIQMYTKMNWAFNSKIFFLLHELGHFDFDHHQQDVKNTSTDTPNNFDEFAPEFLVNELLDDKKKEEILADLFAADWIVKNTQNPSMVLAATASILEMFGYYEAQYYKGSSAHPRSFNRVVLLEKYLRSRNLDTHLTVTIKELRQNSKVFQEQADSEIIKRLVERKDAKSIDKFLQGVAYILSTKDMNLLFNDFLPRFGFYELSFDDIILTEQSLFIYKKFCAMHEFSID